MVLHHVYADSANVQCRRSNAQYGTKGDAGAWIRVLVSTKGTVPYPSSYEAHIGPSPPIPTHQGPANAHSSPQAMNHPMTRSRVTTHPYTRVSCRKKTRPAADYTPNLALVQAHCIADGGDPAAITLLQTVFANGISTTALTRRMTPDEAHEYNHGAPGQVFRVFLREDKEKRSRCRLCAIGTDEGGWKHAKDALRHLKHDHFGLGTRCDRWSVLLSLYRMS